MKRLFINCMLWIPAIGCFAQQAPQFTQFMQMGNVLNPAMTGINRYIDFKMGYRKQWAGLPGSPTTFFTSVSGQFGHEEASISLPVRGRLSSQFVTQKPEQKPMPRHAIGGFISTDQTTPTSLNMANFSYAYHIPLKDNWSLAFGAGISLTQSVLNRDKLDADIKKDPTIGTGLSSKLNPDANAGVFLSSGNFFAGYSANHLFQNQIYSLSDNNTLLGKQRVHHFLHLGGRFNLNENWFLAPALLTKIVRGTDASFDVNCRIGYKDLLWFGPGYRNQDSFSALAGFHLSNFLSLSYAYDYSHTGIGTSANGSHEVMLGIRLVESGTKIYRPSMW
jgi:type IX secretion system PorP/SprF family membrane protein